MQGLKTLKSAEMNKSRSCRGQFISLLCIFICLFVMYWKNNFHAYINDVLLSNDSAPQFYVHDYDKRRNSATVDKDVIPTQQWIPWTNESIFDERICDRINIMPSCATSKVKLLNIDKPQLTIKYISQAPVVCRVSRTSVQL